MDLDTIVKSDNTIPEIEEYTSLHVHTHYSLLDGMCKIPDLVKRAKELGMHSLAVTEHGHLGSAIAFREECIKQKIKPINGIELYMTSHREEASKPVEQRDIDTINRMIAAGILEDKEYTQREIAKIKKNNKNFEKYAYDMRQYHLILLAMNEVGWKNLIKIQSIAAETCTYNGRFLADPELLREYNEGIICTSACIGGIIPTRISQNKYEIAKRWIELFKNIYGDRFFLEIQPITIKKQLLTNAFYCKIHEELGVNVVATTDVHYVNKDDWNDHDTWLCIATGHKKTDTDRLKYSNNYWLHSKEELAEAFMIQEDYYGDALPDNYRQFWIKAIENTQVIADRIEPDIMIGSKTPLYPRVTNMTNELSSDEILYSEVWKGFLKYKKEQDEAGTPIDYNLYLSRLREEMYVITYKHYSDYFLMVKEYVEWGRQLDDNQRPRCITGPGRGSAAGSLVLFFLGVTKADPIKYGLMFGRFLTINRTAIVDVDIDLDWARRNDAIHHLEDVYGKDHVAHIGTWSTESIYTGLKDFARVLNVPFAESNNITKQLQSIIDEPNVSFKDFDNLTANDSNSFIIFKELERKYPEVFRLARKFEGCCRQWGTHASGILVTPMPITELVPIRIDKNTGDTVTLFTGVELDEKNLVKLDLLGLKTLTIFEWTLQAINMSWNEFYKRIGNYDDPEIYKMMQRGETDCVFQFESSMMKGLITSVKPTCLADLAAITACGRPGPLIAGYGDLLAKCKNQGLKQYPIRDCEDILDPSYSLVLFQENCMRISKKVAGFNDMQADSITRKIIGKKKAELFPMMMRCHIYGKKNCEGPKGWEDNDKLPWYDPKGKYGDEIPGAISRGYTEKEMYDYFDKIKGAASYLFNLSHAVTYSQLSYMGAWLKHYYPAQFMASVLSIQTQDEKKAKYIKVCQNMGIHIHVPDINKSDANFTAIDEETITYGLSSVKGVKSIDEILSKRPFTGIEDAVNRLTKKGFNKTVGTRLIKAGAFDSLDGDNRNATLNKFFAARKDKDFYPEELYTRSTTIEYEIESIGSSITFKTAWEKLLPGQRIFNATARLISVKSFRTKKGDMMASGSMSYDGIEVEFVIFPKSYKKYSDYLLPGVDVFLSGSKSKDRDQLIVDSLCIADDATFAAAPVFSLAS